MYISRDGGANWQPFQLNLPLTPITDLKIAHGDLIVATAGRSYWILDDLNTVRELKNTVNKPMLYTPEEVILGNWYSQLDSNNPDFDGTNPFEGVNPANGMVIYYQLPQSTTDQTEIKLEIKDQSGSTIRILSSKPNPDFKSYPGGPRAEPTLTNHKGLNRFVWDLRYPTVPGVPTAYIESSFRGHKAIPGTYTLNLITGNDTANVTGIIKDTPEYQLTSADYQAYHEWMNKLESETKGKQFIEELKAWDEEMVQRKSTAYDDVENFPNKFTANFLFMMNHGESSIPKINQATKDRYSELMECWKPLEAEGKRLLEIAIPEFNKMAIEAVLIGKEYLLYEQKEFAALNVKNKQESEELAKKHSFITRQINEVNNLLISKGIKETIPTTETENQPSFSLPLDQDSTDLFEKYLEDFKLNLSTTPIGLPIEGQVEGANITMD
ncbi:hypothetical protein GHT06_003597 [Daphnia sinensis]|uniref:Uncharacterized protein n=1 Tax=Daphnia sinensis TaxID=1820382 RepID=A0AAD5KTS6_9CRUS|nr:hypothetical protein GHT06_003597 [Daphnia sinensis]